MCRGAGGYKGEAHFVDSEMRQKRLMVVNGKSLESVLHVNSLVHIVERTLLSELHLAHERNAALVGAVPYKVRIEGQQSIDQSLHKA